MADRRRGREARRAAPPAAAAVRPGLPGGRYRPLTAADEQKIHRAVLDVLENIGMGDPIPILRERALERGCRINEHSRLCFPRALVEDVIAGTPKDIRFLGRDPQHDLEIGGERVHTYGSGEEAVVSAAAAQMVNFYGLPSSVGAGMTDAKSPDCQAGYEKALAVALAAHAGCNNISESAGMLGSLMALSLEAMVIDNDMLGSVLRTVRGVEVNDETLSLDVIRQVVHGEGHYLRTEQTLGLMRTEYEYPALADRSTPGEWEAEGSPDIRERAGKRVREILSTHYPEYIDPVVDRKTRDTFPILLPQEFMRPGNKRW
jgi:trimethylamine:corrinoid methyltransferase-like protein